MTNKKIGLITGATGFIGSNLAKRLVRDGWELHAIVRSHSNLDILSEIKDKVNFHLYDETMEVIYDIVAKTKPAIVFHLASLFIAEHKSSDIDALIKSNILFGTQLLEAMVKNNVYKFINTTTFWQNYNNEDYNPVNLYAATKQAFEDIIRYYVESTPLKVINLKLYDTYGPNDPRPKLFNIIKKAEREQKSLLMSPGEQLIDLVYIEDVVDAFLVAKDMLLEENTIKNEHYMVSSGNPIKLRDLIRIYEKITGKKLNIEWGGLPYRKREVMVPYTKGNILPGWSPKIDLEKGILKIISIER